MDKDYLVLKILGHTSASLVVMPFILGLLMRKKFKTTEFILWSLIIVACITELVIQIMRARQINNMYVTHVYTILEFLLISLFFIKTISPSKLVYVMYGLILVFLLIAAYELFNDPRDTSDEISTTFEAIALIAYTLGTFFYMLQNPSQSSVYSIPLFWFNTAILLYFSGNLFLFLFSNYLEAHSKQQFLELWGIHSVLNIIFYILISIGFWKTKER